MYVHVHMYSYNLPCGQNLHIHTYYIRAQNKYSKLIDHLFKIVTLSLQIVSDSSIENVL